MGKGSDPVDIKPTSTLTRGQRGLLDKLTGLLGGELGQPGEIYPGQMYAGAGDIQEQIFGLAKNILGGESATAGAIPMGMGALESVLSDFDPTGMEKYWKDIFVAPAMQQWTQDVVPQIQEKFAGLNALDSGALMREISKSGANLSTNLTSQLSQMLLQGSEAQKNRQLAGLGEALGFAAQPTEQLNALLGVGGTEQAASQTALDELFSKWEMGQEYANPWLKFLGPALGTNAIENIVSPNKNFLQQQSMMGSIGGMMGGGGGCCFKFRKGKELTKEVKAFRDEFFKEGGLVQKGYKIASRFIVPLMDKSKVFEKAVRLLMLRPLRKCAELHYAKSKKSWTWLLAPVGLFWVMLWAVLGAVLPERLQYTWEEYYGIPEGSFASCGLGSGVVVSMGKAERRQIFPFLQLQDADGENEAGNMAHRAFVFS